MLKTDEDDDDDDGDHGDHDAAFAEALSVGTWPCRI